MPSRIDIGPEGGPFVAVNENNNDLELQDINGNVIAKWDETAGNWDFANTSLTNLAAVETDQIISSPDVPKDTKIALKSGLHRVEIYLTDIGETASPITDPAFTRSQVPYLVRVSEQLSDGAQFADLVSYAAGPSGATVLSSHERDNPPARSYSSELNEEELNMSLSSAPSGGEEISSYIDYGGI